MLPEIEAALAEVMEMLADLLTAVVADGEMDDDSRKTIAGVARSFQRFAARASGEAVA